MTSFVCIGKKKCELYSCKESYHSKDANQWKVFMEDAMKALYQNKMHDLIQLSIEQTDICSNGFKIKLKKILMEI